MYKIIILAIMVLSGCATSNDIRNPVSNYGATVQTVQSDATATVEYKSHSFQKNELKKKADLAMWRTEKLDMNIAALHKGGTVIVSIEATTVYQANPIAWEFIAQKMDGTEIARAVGKRSTPHYEVGRYRTRWWNIALFNIDKEITLPFKVFVVDNLEHKRSGFVIRQRM